MNRKRIFTIIQVGNLSDFPSRAYDFALVIAVAVNIFIAIFDTFPEADPYEKAIWVIECITVVFFAVDYLLRIWTADYLYENLSPARARLRFIFSWAGLVDLRYIKWSYLDQFIDFDRQDILFIYGTTLLNDSYVLKR